MASKNGSPELVSLLQYMKETNLDNPEVLVQDERMQRLDSIVSEVKESEEWEAVRMSIYSVALELGYADGQKAGKEIGKETARVEVVCKKLRKGKSFMSIAKDLEEDIAVVEQICEIASAFAPEYESQKVLEEWLRKIGIADK